MQIKRVVGKLQRGFENDTRGRVFQQIGLPALLYETTLYSSLAKNLCFDYLNLRSKLA